MGRSPRWQVRESLLGKGAVLRTVAIERSSGGLPISALLFHVGVVLYYRFRQVMEG